jgi:hypothetical protein
MTRPVRQRSGETVSGSRDGPCARVADRPPAGCSKRHTELSRSLLIPRPGIPRFETDGQGRVRTRFLVRSTMLSRCIGDEVVQDHPSANDREGRSAAPGQAPHEGPENHSRSSNATATRERSLGIRRPPESKPDQGPQPPPTGGQTTCSRRLLPESRQGASDVPVRIVIPTAFFASNRAVVWVCALICLLLDVSLTWM